MPYEKIGKNEPVCIADEVPFDVPESWAWVRLKDITIKEIKRGKSPTYANSGNVLVFAQKCNTKAGNIDLSLTKHLDLKVFTKYPDEEYMRDNDIVINSTGNGTLGRIGVFRDSDRIDDCIIVPDSHVTTVRVNAALISDYIYYALTYYQPYLEKNCSGSTNQTELKPAVIANLFIPVPPYAEQRRIVQKLSDVLPLVMVYNDKETALETYNNDFPSQLKKSILQYAVQGKLVPQDPADEPASVLLERIRAEKEQLIKSGKIKRDKHESVIFRRDNSYYEKVDGIERCIDDDLPFEIPESWEWCRLGTILQKLTDGTHSTPKYTARGIPFISVKDISSGKISFERTKFISKTEHELLASRCDPHRDDILLTKVGTTGIPVLVDTDRPFSIFVSVAQLRFPTELLDKFFLIYLLKSPLVQTQCRENTKGVGNKNWVMRDIANTLICIPPLAEQKRIQASLANVLKSI